ncbi:hypothetical protein [Streptomyces milbemycinicus]|uniref:hypothetical protein n=1 Tax=Streptomyces milbemycinicus TaxID=476552 RepID=UPI000A3836E9|nr:hypothetical protein [Streptomyces milbemycinicus]
MNGQLTDSRVRTRDFGPYPARLDPTNRWSGYVRPLFTLDAVRQIAGDTQAFTQRYGHHNWDTVHVLDGGTGPGGERRTIVLIIGWESYDDGQSPQQVTDVIEPTEDGLYGIGDGCWPWDIDPSAAETATTEQPL